MSGADIDLKADMAARREVPPMSEIHNYIASNGSGIGSLLNATFLIRTLDEAGKLATLLACHCPDPDRTAPGIWELLSNSIEHGNLAISFDEKTKLLNDGTFHLEIERRLKTEPYCRRNVRVEFWRLADRIRIVISDEGEGFDYKMAMRRQMPLHLPNGRGITIASQLSFDAMAYQGCGNCVEATVGLAA